MGEIGFPSTLINFENLDENFRVAKEASTSPHWHFRNPKSMGTRTYQVPKDMIRWKEPMWCKKTKKILHLRCTDAKIEKRAIREKKEHMRWVVKWGMGTPNQLLSSHGSGGSLDSLWVRAHGSDRHPLPLHVTTDPTRPLRIAFVFVIPQIYMPSPTPTRSFVTDFQIMYSNSSCSFPSLSSWRTYSFKPSFFPLFLFEF